ncbi:MAG: 1-deoxy-D-xylulose-5-phosphate reductoisomerase [Planctomycetes bacterium]|nr:1-deoxy-D-xylulose-5-phosphate reductoisomerase [Planctomycetota bacterium]
MKRIAVLGSTGSIGVNALDVLRHLASECRVSGLSARSNWRLLEEQAREFRPARVAVSDPGARAELGGRLNGTTIHADPAEIAAHDDVDVVLCAITGAAGLAPGLAALGAGKTLALANKESLVAAGPLMIEAARRGGGRIVPVDSEHNAVFQAMRSGRHEEVRRIVLTASGGPFRDTPLEALAEATVEQALKHPTWNMGAKITIDSATMFNKALEIVEARWLFDVDPSKIEVVIHPQSIVHSIVEFADGSMIAQMGVPDMRTPIQYAITHPQRLAGLARPLDLVAAGALTFRAPDLEKFPSLEMGWRAARAGGTMGAVMNAANEAAVALFLDRRIPFPRIFQLVRAVMDRHELVAEPTLDDVRKADAWARSEVRCSTS